MESRLASNLTLLALLVFCAIFAQSCTIPQNINIENRDPYRHHHFEQPASILPAEQLSNSRPLGKRMIPNGFSLHDTQVLDFIQPVNLAARGLQLFYNQMLHHAVYVWPNLAPASVWRMQLGAFQLVMATSGFEAIPWTFVVEFARMMTAMTTMGFTSTYQMAFESPETNRVILVTMVMQTTEQLADSLGGYSMVLGPAGSR
ncbi:MAG: hypothetical protein Q9226_006160 [Calogaya cf. arnoldii]